MKTKLMILLTCLMVGVSAHAFKFKYQGYAETYGSYLFNNNNIENAAGFGVCTTHGGEIIPGLFVGAGIDLAYIRSNKSRYSESCVMFCGYAEGRYKILPEKRVSPFASFRVGGGYNGFEEEACPYIRPAVGCAFNFTEKFGMDAALGYVFYGEESGSTYQGIQLTVGIHF